MDEYRRTISELLARYELEPTIRDVFVEGDGDRAIVTWFTEEVGCKNVFVYDIGTVDVSEETLVTLGLTNNNRGRVIALSKDLSSHSQALSSRVVCIVDRDFDLWTGADHNCGLLLMTDYTCMEMYMFNHDHLRKFFHLIARHRGGKLDHVVATLARTLQELFLIRFANITLDLNLTWMSFPRCCQLTATKDIQFDSEDFIEKYLNKNSALDKKAALKAKIDESRRLLSNDPRHQANGHDFIELLDWYLNQLQRRGKIAGPSLDRVLVGCLDSRSLGREPLFMELASRLT